MKHCPQCSGTYPDEYAVCPKDGTRLAAFASWEPNSVVRAKYKIVSKIGEGGMATVYKAHHELLDEVRALKVIKSELARDAQFVQRFKNEAINTRKLQHPNAVRVDDLDIAEDGRPFMAMELRPLLQIRGLIRSKLPNTHGPTRTIIIWIRSLADPTGARPAAGDPPAQRYCPAVS